jgi:ankyrin repeat protein
MLLEAGANVNAVDKLNLSSLRMASQNGHVEIVRILLDHEADVDITRKGDDTTSLSVAAKTGHANVVKQLLMAGADVDAADRYGSTPLFFASRAGHVETVKVLMEHKADVNVEASFLGKQFTPLGVAEYLSYDEVVKVLR